MQTRKKHTHTLLSPLRQEDPILLISCPGSHQGTSPQHHTETHKRFRLLDSDSATKCRGLFERMGCIPRQRHHGNKRQCSTQTYIRHYGLRTQMYVRIYFYSCMAVYTAVTMATLSQSVTLKWCFLFPLRHKKRIWPGCFFFFFYSTHPEMQVQVQITRTVKGTVHLLKRKWMNASTLIKDQMCIGYNLALRSAEHRNCDKIHAQAPTESQIWSTASPNLTTVQRSKWYVVKCIVRIYTKIMIRIKCFAIQ